MYFTFLMGEKENGKGKLCKKVEMGSGFACKWGLELKKEQWIIELEWIREEGIQTCG